MVSFDEIIKGLNMFYYLFQKCFYGVLIPKLTRRAATVIGTDCAAVFDVQQIANQSDMFGSRRMILEGKKLSIY